jgi:hypothetical protein
MKGVNWQLDPDFRDPVTEACLAYVGSSAGRFELSVYELPAENDQPGLCGFEVFSGAHFGTMVGSGVAPSFASPKRAAERFVWGLFRIENNPTAEDRPFLATAISSSG